MTDEVVTRLYRALVEELRRRGHQDDRPLKVSELYQTLVPYSTVRSSLGVELNADYEHALLRLLAGERNLLRMEPEEAREELRREVSAPYPYVGLFRKFSSSDVWITMPELDADAEPADRSTEVATERPSHGAADREPVRLQSAGGADPAPERPPVQLHPSAPQQQPSERLIHAATVCAFCTEDLPSGRRARFCPHCGGDQRLQPCPRCDAVLEREWRYCISCGHDTSAS